MADQNAVGWKWDILLVVIIVLIAIGYCSRANGEELSGTVPKGVPDPSGWPVRPIEEGLSTGTLRLANTTVTFKLSAERGRAAIYRVARYRTCDYAAQACDPETLLWLRPGPDGRHPVAAIYYRFQRRTWKKLWLGREWYWYQLPHGSPEYRMEAKRAGNLFFLLDNIRQGADPASLTF
jgi:hypothetical protein